MYLNLDTEAVPPAEIPQVIGELAAAHARLLARLTAATASVQIEPEYLKIGEVALRTGLSKSHLYELIRRGNLPAREFGGAYRVAREDLLSWEARHRKAGIDERIRKMLNSDRDRTAAPTGAKAARPHPGAARRQARRAPRHGEPLGDGPRPGAEGRGDGAPSAETPAA